MAEVATREFVLASQAAVKDEQLRQALRRAGTGFDGTRREAIAEVSEEVWEEWRQQARRIKEHTIAHLDYYLAMAGAERGGGRRPSAFRARRCSSQCDSFGDRPVGTA